MWREFLKFANSGAVGTLAHYLLLWVLVGVGVVNPIIGSIVGATIGAGINYLLNYHWTFSSQLPHSHTLPRFFAIATFSLVLNTILMTVLTSLGTFHYLVAQVIATSICLATNYLASRFLAFGGNS